MSHDWFTDKRDPTTNQGCCGGNDCATVPQQMIDSGAVSPVATGIDVRLTLSQVQHFNKYAKLPVSEHIPWSRVQPDQSRDPNGTGYSLCIVWSVRCAFGPVSY